MRKRSRSSGGQVLVDAAGDGPGAVDLLAGGGQDDLLAELAQQHGLDRQLLVLQAPTPMTFRMAGSASMPEEEVGRGEVEEVQGVRLEHLAVVHEPAHLLGRRGEPSPAPRRR